MNLLDAIKLYCHIMQQASGGLPGREAASSALKNHGFTEVLIEAIAICVTNEGHLNSGRGGTYAITQISAS